MVKAGHLLKKVDEYLASGADKDRKEVKATMDLLAGQIKGPMDQLRQRAAECVTTLRDWHSVRS